MKLEPAAYRQITAARKLHSFFNHIDHKYFDRRTRWFPRLILGWVWFFHTYRLWARNMDREAEALLEPDRMEVFDWLVTIGSAGTAAPPWHRW